MLTNLTTYKYIIWIITIRKKIMTFEKNILVLVNLVNFLKNPLDIVI